MSKNLFYLTFIKARAPDLCNILQTTEKKEKIFIKVQKYALIFYILNLGRVLLYKTIITCLKVTIYKDDILSGL